MDDDDITFSDNGDFYNEKSKNGIINSLTERNCYIIGGAYKWYTGGDSTVFLFEGNIYSIRVYNRKLSEEELRNNYEVDKARFEME